MSTNRVKKAAEWFYSNVFRDEAIQPRIPKPANKLPSLLRTARSLENATTGVWQSRESIFLKQAKLLVNYEDDYEYTDNIVRYYPTYQSLTDQELRGYFSWRTKLRKGDVQKSSRSFAFLYIYELLNQVGVADPMDGYEKLRHFQQVYGEIDGGILPYLNQWMTDYVIYYGLDANLLAPSAQVRFDRCLTVLDHVSEQELPKIIDAVKYLSPKWLERSRFYAAYRQDFDQVIVRVLRRISDHCGEKCKKTMVEQYFGSMVQFQVSLFSTAVFCNPLKKQNREYVLDERCIYHCKAGLWTVTMHPTPAEPNSKLNDLLKAIDAVMREVYGYGHPIQYKVSTKWILKMIREETQAVLDEKKAAEAKKITIDYSKLSKIRKDAAITQEKLTVEDEIESELPIEPAPPEKETVLSFLPAEEPETVPTQTPLDPAEYRLLQCLLYGRDTHWVQKEGYLLSVLVDGINEKLYDEFMDSVLDDTPELIEDYIDELKEMVHQ